MDIKGQWLLCNHHRVDDPHLDHLLFQTFAICVRHRYGGVNAPSAASQCAGAVLLATFAIGVKRNPNMARTLDRT
eukprot:5790728-Karenia_brevis.AAC.1